MRTTDHNEQSESEVDLGIAIYKGENEQQNEPISKIHKDFILNE